MYPGLQILPSPVEKLIAVSRVLALTARKWALQRCTSLIPKISEVLRVTSESYVNLFVFKKMVGAIGFEFWVTRIFNNILSHGGHRKAVEGSGEQF